MPILQSIGSFIHKEHNILHEYDLFVDLTGKYYGNFVDFKYVGLLPPQRSIPRPTKGTSYVVSDESFNKMTSFDDLKLFNPAK